jgi:hypothetical protein
VCRPIESVKMSIVYVCMRAKERVLCMYVCVCMCMYVRESKGDLTFLSVHAC